MGGISRKKKNAQERELQNPCSLSFDCYMSSSLSLSLFFSGLLNICSTEVMIFLKLLYQ